MNKTLLIAVAVALVLGGLAGYALAPKSNPALGTTISAYNALNQQVLINDFNSITSDLQNLRTPLAGIETTTTASLAFPTFGTAGAGSATSTLATTTVIGVSLLPGDQVLVSPNWGTVPTNSITFAASVFATSTTNGTISITAFNGTTTVQSPPATTFFVTVLPKATFIAPGALNTATST